MMNIQKLLMVTAMGVALTACGKESTLEERLALASKSERQEIAYAECMRLATSEIPGGHNRENRYHKCRQWTLCEEMNKLNEPKE